MVESNSTVPYVGPSYCRGNEGWLSLLMKKTILVSDVSGDDEDVGAAAVVAVT
jgi:hypothetical protein